MAKYESCRYRPIRSTVPELYFKVLTMNFFGEEAKPQPAFNPLQANPQPTPDFLTFLTEEFRNEAEKHNQQLKIGETPIAIEETLASAKPLLDFCERYLRANRPVQTFPLDNNYGFLLSNHKRCAISPSDGFVGGLMQESYSVPVY